VHARRVLKTALPASSASASCGSAKPLPLGEQVTPTAGHVEDNDAIDVDEIFDDEIGNRGEGSGEAATGSRAAPCEQIAILM
jgi:hypothetical protein